MLTDKQLIKFWRKVEKTESCWLYRGGLDRDGYGIHWANRSYKAHRLSAMLANKDMTKPIVRHMCHNPACVNPDHLETGFQADNIKDMMQANRQNLGHGGRKKVPVITPMGEYESIAAASQAHKVDHTTIVRKLHRAIPGWRYKNNDK